MSVSIASSTAARSARWRCTRVKSSSGVMFVVLLVGGGVEASIVAQGLAALLPIAQKWLSSRRGLVSHLIKVLHARAGARGLLVCGRWVFFFMGAVSLCGAALSMAI